MATLAAVAGVDVAAAAVVYLHALWHGKRHPRLWAAAVLLLVVVALPAYVVLALVDGGVQRA